MQVQIASFKFCNSYINTFHTVGEDLFGKRDTTWGSLMDAVNSAAVDATPILGWFADRSKGDKLYDAMANFKIALTAGHYKYTAGKRCMKKLDPKETREWVLNDRIADKITALLAANYIGYELLRTDDTTGEKSISLNARTNAANNWGADFYLSIHHNAGINGGKGGGITAHVCLSPQKESLEWQKALYDALIAATGLKGNRAEPLVKQNLHECRETKMPAVLLELGFMDSATDVPIILTEEYADKCAAAIVKVLAERGKLEKKPAGDGKIYRVQVGAYTDKANAEAMLEKLHKSAFGNSFINYMQLFRKSLLGKTFLLSLFTNNLSHGFGIHELSLHWQILKMYEK